MSFKEFWVLNNFISYIYKLKKMDPIYVVLSPNIVFTQVRLELNEFYLGTVRTVNYETVINNKVQNLTATVIIPPYSLPKRICYYQLPNNAEYYLAVVLELSPHNLFVLNGINVEMSLNVSLDEATNGIEHVIEYLNGELLVINKRGLYNSTDKIIFPYYGFYDSATRRYGNLIVTFNIVIKPTITIHDPDDDTIFGSTPRSYFLDLDIFSSPEQRIPSLTPQTVTPTEAETTPTEVETTPTEVETTPTETALTTMTAPTIDELTTARDSIKYYHYVDEDFTSSSNDIVNTFMSNIDCNSNTKNVMPTWRSSFESGQVVQKWSDERPTCFDDLDEIFGKQAPYRPRPKLDLHLNLPIRKRTRSNSSWFSSSLYSPTVTREELVHGTPAQGPLPTRSISPPLYSFPIPVTVINESQLNARGSAELPHAELPQLSESDVSCELTLPESLGDLTSTLSEVGPQENGLIKSSACRLM